LPISYGAILRVPPHGVLICRSFCSRRQAVNLSRWTNRTGGASILRCAALLARHFSFQAAEPLRGLAIRSPTSASTRNAKVPGSPRSRVAWASLGSMILGLVMRKDVALKSSDSRRVGGPERYGSISTNLGSALPKQPPGRTSIAIAQRQSRGGNRRLAS
jgi:hypothetical protein